MKNQPKQNRGSAFTLVEMLVVIGVIALLASMVTIGGLSVLNKAKIKRCQAELAQLKSAIDYYKAKKGFYPPDNKNNNFQTNALYYELVGMKSAGANFVTLDGQDTVTPAMLTAMGISGFANHSVGGSATDDAAAAERFIKEVGPKQVQTNKAGIKLFISPVYDANLNDFNPWYYNSHNPTNNTDSYDLWTIIRVGKTTNMICNWNDRPIAL